MESSKFDPHVNWLPPAYASATDFRALNPLNEETTMEDDDQQSEQQKKMEEKNASKVTLFL
jgi:hypothetical protein